MKTFEEFLMENEEKPESLKMANLSKEDIRYFTVVKTFNMVKGERGNFSRSFTDDEVVYSAIDMQCGEFELKRLTKIFKQKFKDDFISIKNSSINWDFSVPDSLNQKRVIIVFKVINDK